MDYVEPFKTFQELIGFIILLPIYIELVKTVVERGFYSVIPKLLPAFKQCFV